MRIPFLSMFVSSPFDGIEEHSQKVKECAAVFQQAIECLLSDRCDRFDELRKEVSNLESQADAIKRRVRGHLPRGTMMPVEKFKFFRYLREEDSVLDGLKTVLDWVSFRLDPGIPQSLGKDIKLLVDAALAPVDQLCEMVQQAHDYFQTYSETQRRLVKETIHKIRHLEHEADHHERDLKHKLLNMDLDPITVFHMIRMVEFIGDIADHAENAGDMMRAMVAK